MRTVFSMSGSFGCEKLRTKKGGGLAPFWGGGRVNLPGKVSCDTLKTITSFNNESRTFFLNDNSIWSFPSVSSLKIVYFNLAIRAFGASEFILPKYDYRLGQMDKRSVDSLIEGGYGLQRMGTAIVSQYLEVSAGVWCIPGFGAGFDIDLTPSKLQKGAANPGIRHFDFCQTLVCTRPWFSENSRRLWLPDIPCWKSFPAIFDAAGK